jgi:photosystem II stability/assembly factor-like uncharacterized protein
MKKIGSLTFLLVAALILAGCLPFPPVSQPTAIPTGEQLPTLPPEGPTAVPTNTTEPVPTNTPPAVPTATEAATPVPTVTTVPTSAPTATSAPRGDKVAVGWIQMINSLEGWGVGGNRRPFHRLLRTEDAGSTWYDETPSGAIPDIYSTRIVADFISADEGWALFYVPGSGPIDLVTWHTKNGGSTWKKSAAINVDFVGLADFPPFMVFTDTMHGWLMLHNGAAGMHNYPIYLLKTTDGGATWSVVVNPVGGPIQSCNKTGMDFVGTNDGWVTYDNCPITGAQISVTHDGGANWTDVALPAPASDPTLFTHAFCNSYYPSLFTSTSGAVMMECAESADPTDISRYLYKTTDDGATWSTSDFPGESMLFVNKNVGWAFGARIYRTLDGGATWDPKALVTWRGQFSFVDRYYGWGIVSSGAGSVLVKTINGGASWATVVTSFAP